ncbi:MAG TPA: beta-galactosidase [Gemmatimonadales bacterium]|nr:beta-galactosidase [Gemmatimonadales bacterium]
MRSRGLLLAGTAGALLFGAPSAGHQRSAREPDFFPFAVWYSGGKARAPMLSALTPNSREEWRRDLQQIKQLGFNTVRTWVEWAEAEPRRGEYHLENLRLLLELAQETGLRVMVQMYVDAAPDWVGKAYPYARFVTQSGVVIPSQVAPGFCTDNPEIRHLVDALYSAVARVASRYPSFYGWDLWSEPHIINWAEIDYVPNAQFCYCRATQARFREWLRRKYGTLAALNRAWHRQYAMWSDVEPPRFSTILSYTDYLDWKAFISDRLANDLAARYAAVRAGGSTHVITAHAAISSLFTSPHAGEGASDDFRMAEKVDFYGVSIYPKHNRPETHWPVWQLLAMLDFQRSANRPNQGWYIGELQGGEGNIALLHGDPVTAADQRVWVWSAIAAGARAINVYAYYPMSSGYESGGYGLINLDGTVTDRAASTGAIGRVVTANQALFLDARPVPAHIGIVYNPLAQLVGGAERRQDYPEALRNSLIGYYRALTEANIPVDFIHRTELETGDLSRYALIIVPYPIMFTQAAANGLRHFVKQGGHAVAEARLAWNDERGFAAEVVPGAGLHEVFGVREKHVWMRREPILAITGSDSTVPLTAGLHALRGALYASTVDVLAKDARVLATTDGEPAVVASRYGKGQTLFIGSYIGWGNQPDQQRDNTEFIRRLADWAGVTKPVATSQDGMTPPLVARLHEGKQGYVLFLVNHDSAGRDAAVSVSVPSGTYGLTDLTTGATRSATSEAGVLRFSTNVGGRDAQVWSVKTVP